MSLENKWRQELTAPELPPEMTPLVSPGMPCILVTLLLLKYSLQVALNSDPSQNSFQSLVVTVTFSISSVFRHRSKLWFCRVRFPNMQTLGKGTGHILKSRSMLIKIQMHIKIFNQIIHQACNPSLFLFCIISFKHGYWSFVRWILLGF